MSVYIVSSRLMSGKTPNYMTIYICSTLEKAKEKATEEAKNYENDSWEGVVFVNESKLDEECAIDERESLFSVNCTPVEEGKIEVPNTPQSLEDLKMISRT